MTNPFDNANGRFYALVNEEGQYSLWPVTIDVPSGWQIALTESSHQACLDFIEAAWTDMRPKSLIAAMKQG